jgi:glycosyltransferase involved in cell wall biosynthesis
MACGLPVVASSRAGVTEIVSHGVNGIVLRDPEDADEIADVLKSLLTDAELRRRLGEEGARTAQQETWDRNAQATWDWLNEVLQRKTESIANRQRT